MYRAVRIQFVALFVLVSFIGVGQIKAQHQFSGTVLDAETGEPLPAAGIRILGTYTGTITNVEGQFSLDVPTLPSTIAIRYVGYQSAEVELTTVSPASIRVLLDRAIVPLDEVVVTGENPAIDIMRRVIERKAEMRSALESYSADAYNRFTISNDTGIVSIIESFTQAFWRKGEGLREINIRQEKTANLPIEDLLPAAMLVTNLYDDNIELSGYDMPGVTHPNALSIYRFYLVDHLYLDDQLVYEIRVEPRGKRRVGFKGSIRVLAEEYVLLEVNLSPGRSFIFPPPIDDIEVVMYQQFTDFGDGVWLPSDLHANTRLKISFGRLLTFPEVGINQLSRLTNYNINASTPDSLFERKPDEVVASDSTYPAEYYESLSVPLTAKEAEAYDSIDSTLTLEKAFEPGGVFGRGANLDFSFGDDSTEASDRWVSREFVPQLFYNRVEGLRVGGKASLKTTGATGIEVFGGATYMTALKDAGYSFGAAIFSGNKVRSRLAIEYGSLVEPRYRSQVFDEVTNSVLVLLGRKDYFDYLKTQSLSISTMLECVPLKSGLELRFESSDQESVETNTSYDLFGRSEMQPDNPAIAEGSLRSFEARLSINDRGNVASITGSRTLRLELEHSSPDIAGSDFDFTVGRATLDWRLNTFGRRRLIPQTLDFRVSGIVSRGSLPTQALHIVDTSNGLYTPFGSLRTGGVRPYEADRGLAVFWEHNFRTSPFEMIGAWSLAREGITISVFGGHATTSVTASSAATLFHSPRTTDGWYHEVGVSVGGLLGILRLDVAKRLDGKGASVGVAAGRLF